MFMVGFMIMTIWADGEAFLSFTDQYIGLSMIRH